MMGTFDEWQAQKDSQYILAVDYLEQLAKRHDSTIEATANHLIHCDSLKEIYEKSDNGEYYPAYEPTGYGYYDNDTPPPRIQFLESAKANTDTTGKILSKDFYRMWDNNYFKKSELPAIEPVEPNEPRKNNNEIIAEIVAKADIVKIIGKHVELKRSGNDFKGCCPFHGEKTPSFFINPKKGLYNCFGCGVSGNALTFLKDYEGMTAGEALKELSRQTGIGLPNQDNETKLSKAPYKNEKNPFNSIASFITSYNLPQVTALILGINFEHLTVHENNTYIDQNECPQEKVLQFDRLLQSLVIMAKNGNLQGIAVTFYTPYSFNHVLTTPPKQEFDYLNSVIDKDNLEKYLKSIGKDLSQLLELQESLTAPTPQTDSQLSQKVADLNAQLASATDTIASLQEKLQQSNFDRLESYNFNTAELHRAKTESNQYQKENESLKAKIAELEANEPSQSDTPADGEPLALVFDSTNANYAPDLVHALNLWLDLYHRNPKDSDSHTNKANIWLKNNTAYEYVKRGDTAMNRIREIATPLKDFGQQRAKEPKK
jgi:BMFP domain-containing protein YqiC